MKRVLYIDNDNSWTILVTHKVSTQGYPCEASIHQGYESWLRSQSNVAVVITEIDFKELRDVLAGLEMIANIKSILPHARIIVFSGLCYSNGLSQRALNAGADRYVRKADGIDRLLDAVAILTAEKQVTS